MSRAKIDLHIHSREGSDGRWTLREIFEEAHRRGLTLVSVTDHDSLGGQAQALELASGYGIGYVTGVELNVTFTHPDWTGGKPLSLDFLGYGVDISDDALNARLEELRAYRRQRAAMILERINEAFARENREPLTAADMAAIEAEADGSLGRPHIARYLVAKGIVATRQEAFDRYLVSCDVPKLPLGIEEASALVRGAGGRIVLAHPDDPNGTSLVQAAGSLEDRARMIEETMLPFIDGIECWHTRHTERAASFYRAFADRRGLIATGGSDCHQNPVIMGSVPVPDCVAGFFGV
ncbi:MAG TPA: PHP domain-containing protein [Deltaproteobacteria bacterium]|nr:PHP domain-containing protein [Deltaproteobacteria bacterium]HPP81080.1 PHP domain-containing protein [Deltaproteobacteria bacterium]